MTIILKNVSKKFVIGKIERKSLLGTIINPFRKRTTEFSALNNINIKIKDGESVAIIGPNGSGKSTLLNIIAGILTPNSGTVYVDQNITPILQLGVGFHLELTVKENVYIYGAVLSRNRRYINERFDDIINFAGLERFVNTKLKDLSSGMQLRLAFSIAIHTEPETLLLDEVLAVGDAEFTRKCLKVISKFKRDNKSIIFVSHDFLLIKRFFKRCVYIKEGKIVLDGDTSKVVASYLKDMKM